MNHITLLGAVASLLVSACGPTGGACTANLVAGIQIEVLDDASGNPIFCGARALVTASG